MSSLNGVKFATLRALYYTGAMNEMWFEYLGDKGGVGDTINDRFKSWMDDVQPTKKQVNDAWNTYLGSLGYTGNLNNREIQYWTAEFTAVTGRAFNEAFDIAFGD
jgi:hypothetical protein